MMASKNMEGKIIVSTKKAIDMLFNLTKNNNHNLVRNEEIDLKQNKERANKLLNKIF